MSATITPATDTNTTAANLHAEDLHRATPPGNKRASKVQLPPKTGNRSSRVTKSPRASSRHGEVPAVLLAAAVAYLAKRERVIDAGRRGSMAMAIASFEIKNYDKGNLLQGRYKSIADYAEQRFGFDKAYSSMLLKTGRFMARCQEKFTMVNKLPQSERQVRSLLRLPEEEQIPVWEDAVKDRDADQVSGKLVTEKVLKRAEALGLQWAKPSTPEAAPPVTPAATSVVEAPPPAAPPAFPEEVTPATVALAAPAEATDPAPASKPPIALPGQHLDDIIGAAIDHLDAVTKHHRRAVEWEVMITKCRLTLNR